MKKMIWKRLVPVIVIVMFLALLLNYVLQVKNCRDNMISDSRAMFGQIERILAQNQRDTEVLEADYTERCLNSAKAAAYIIQNNPDVLYDVEEMQKIAAFLQVDELHIFNEKGVLYAGSVPKYYDYSFDSGEQIGFFKPMLEDKGLELCQEITPNTAEGKLMQYSAVWDEAGDKIIQIGMEPTRVVEFMKKNELSYIFSLLVSNTGVVMYALDPQTGEILGATETEAVGKCLKDIGIDKEVGDILNPNGFCVEIEEQCGYCYFESKGSVILGRICSNEFLYRDMNYNTIILAVFLVMLATLLVFYIIRYLNKNIVKGISDVNKGLVEITNGNLDATVEVNTTPEFMELSGHINKMVKSILDTTDKLSMVLDSTDISVGVYEYGAGMARVRVTNQVAPILGLSDERAERLFADYILFADYLDVIRSNPYDEEKLIYRVPGEQERYVKLEICQKDKSTFGMITDMSETVAERIRLEKERDFDTLTCLRTRGALYNVLDKLFEKPQELKKSMLVMVDADNLKTVNDQWGHEAGDKYLCKVAECLQSIHSQKAVVSRLGGDEFVLFIYGCETERELEQCVEILETKRKKEFIMLEDNSVFEVRFSYGIAFYPEESMDYHELMKRADERMYEEKRNRKEKK